MGAVFNQDDTVVIAPLANLCKRACQPKIVRYQHGFAVACGGCIDSVEVWQAIGLQAEIGYVQVGQNNGRHHRWAMVGWHQYGAGGWEPQLQQGLIDGSAPAGGEPGVSQILNAGEARCINYFATGDIVLIQDADLEYDPQDYPTLLAPILDNRADVVYGSRFLGGPHRVLMFWHYLGNLLFTFLTDILYNVNLTDMGVGYKVFRADAIKDLTLRSNRFGFEPEITAKICKRHCRLYEVPISYGGRTYAEGKKITWRDGFVYLWCLLRYRFYD